MHTWRGSIDLIGGKLRVGLKPTFNQKSGYVSDNPRRKALSPIIPSATLHGRFPSLMSSPPPQGIIQSIPVHSGDNTTPHR